MNYPTQLFIDGAFRDAKSGRRTTLINPATETALAQVDHLSEHADELVRGLARKAREALTAQ